MDEKGQDFVAKTQATAIASGDPLPGPLGDAFCGGPITVAGVQVRKVVASDWKVFKAVNSPVQRMLDEMRQNPDAPEEITFKEEEQWVLAWQFTHTPEQVRSALADGPDGLTARATAEVGDDWAANKVDLVTAAVMEQLKRQWITALKHHAEAEEKGEISFFQDAGVSPKTAPAGGSST